MPKISDETEQTKTVVAGQRAYIVPADVTTEIERLRAENERLQAENDSMRSRELDRAFDALCVKDDDRGRLIAAIHREHSEVDRLRNALRFIRDSFWIDGECFSDRLNDVQKIAGKALAGGE
jgi:predicted RNase H-like nuclease (RuvC/YqgF family)